MAMNLKNILLAGVFVLMAVVAVLGWARNPAPASAHTTNASNYVQPDSSAQPAGYKGTQNRDYSSGCADRAMTDEQYADQQSQAELQGSDQQATYERQDQGYINSVQRPVVVRAETATPVSAYAPPPDNNYVPGRRERVAVRHRHRSFKKSLAIVAGTAGTGAAIGALAGGGTGAGIGALAGGAGGFVYDRLTHNH